MEYEIPVIDEYPFRCTVALHAGRPRSMLFELLDHFVRDGLHLTYIRSAGDDEEVCKASDLPEIQDDYLKSLLVARGAQSGADPFVKFVATISGNLSFAFSTRPPDRSFRILLRVQNLFLDS